MLGATTYLSADVAAHPLLWLPPLVLYLLSFILVFSPSVGRLPDRGRFWVLVLPVLVLLLLFLMLSGAPLGIGWTIALHLAVLFVVCMVCHGELARDRPSAVRLTEFFLWIAVGGVLGGVFNALVAPLAFYAVVEYPLALVLACLLLPPIDAKKESMPSFRVEAGLAVVFAAVGLLLLGLRLYAGGLDASGLAAGRWLWHVAALLAAGATGTVYVLRARDGLRARAMDFLLPLALGVLVVGLLWGVAAPAVYGPLSGIAAALGHRPATLQKAVALGLPAVLCFTFVNRSVRFGLGAGAFLLAAGFCGLFDSTMLYQTRDFFGVLQVTKTQEDGRDYYSLYSGSTLHGRQAVGAGFDRGEPLAYYHRSGPIGQIFAACNGDADPPRDLAVIGLGTGALAAYARKGQKLTFYEIDPRTADFCRDGGIFTYWSDAAERGARLKLVLGDARLTLADEAQSGTEKCGILVVDAFNSDAIPIHLIDREALTVYLDRLADGGVLAFHISNLNLDLRPVLANLARDANLAGLYEEDGGDGVPGKSASTWVVLARRKEDLARLPRERGGQNGAPRAAWEELRPDDAVGVVGRTITRTCWACCGWAIGIPPTCGEGRRHAIWSRRGNLTATTVFANPLTIRTRGHSEMGSHHNGIVGFGVRIPVAPFFDNLRFVGGCFISRTYGSGSEVAGNGIFR